MRVTSFAFSVLGLAVALAAPAAAQIGPTEYVDPDERLAPVGLVLNPTAYSIPAGRWVIGGGTFQQTIAGDPGLRQYSFGAYRGFTGNFHAGAFWTGVERERIGRDDVLESFFGGTLHWMFARETRSFPALAIGGYGYLGPTNGGTVYVSASKNLASTVKPGAIFLHAGARWDAFDDGVSDDDLQPYIGASWLATRNLSFNAEWRLAHPWEDNDVTAFGLNYLIDNTWAISAGVQNVGAGDSRFFAGLSIIP